MFRRIALATAFAASAPAVAQETEREEPALEFTGELRARAEALDGEFRANGEGGDQLVMLRALLHGRYDAGPVTFGVELQDSRIYFGDEDTPTSAADPLDILQAYVEFGDDGDEPGFTLRLGRQTVGIGSERQIERRDYDNVIVPFTGAQLDLRFARDDSLHLLAVVPVEQEPVGAAERGDNRHEFNSEQWNRRIFAAHYIRPNLAPELIPGLSGDLFVYALFEEDTDEAATPSRRIVWPGFRLFRAAASEKVNLDIEGAWRFGSRRATSGNADVTNLDVNASMLLARVGYTLRGAWRPNLAVQYYWASGDADPNDGSYGQFERFFGSRRTDLNNTSIYGPLTVANLSAPGVRFEVRPSSRFDARITYSAAFLASATGSWAVTNLRDPTGMSGSFIGHAIDTRFRRRLRDTRWEIEAGASALIFGDFPKRVANGPGGNGTVFGYLQLTFTF